MKYYDLLVSGSYTPQTVPTGGKALTEKFQPPAPTQPDTVTTQTNLSSATLKRTLCFPIMPSSHCPIFHSPTGFVKSPTNAQNLRNIGAHSRE